MFEKRRLTARQPDKKATKLMLKYLANNKWHAAVVAAGFAMLFVLVGYWAQHNTADARGSLLKGDYPSAIKQYERAANKGDPIAQNTLGNIYYLGLGVTRNYEEAARWYLGAAKSGYGPALVNLGILHRHGLGVKQDMVKAYACFRLADKIGIKNAETHRKFLTRQNYITAHMVEAAMRNYRDLQSLTNNVKIGTAPQQSK